MLNTIGVATAAMLRAEQRLATVARNAANEATPGDKAPGRAGREGALTQSPGQLDLAVSGQGYFRVARPDGALGYTRGGTFKVDARGRIVTAAGDRLQPPVTVPPGSGGISVAMDGSVSAASGGRLEPVGRILLATFANPDGLVATGDGLLSASAESGAESLGSAGAGTIVQGYLEGSNASPVDDAAVRIESPHGYDALGQVIRTADDMQRSPLDLRG